MDFKRAVSGMLQHRCDVYRAASEVREDGVTVVERVLVIEGVRCRLAKVLRRFDDYDEGLPNTKIRTDEKLFCQQNLICGDMVEVTSEGGVSRYLCGEGFVYPTHCEIPLTRWIEA